MLSSALVPGEDDNLATRTRAPAAGSLVTENLNGQLDLYFDS